ncbi:MAG: hypothetical protein AB7O66_03020 [Limisphaerales bacterium]
MTNRETKETPGRDESRSDGPGHDSPGEWRQPWIRWTALIVAVEVATVAVLSSRGTPGVARARAPIPRFRLITEPAEVAGSGRAAAWSALMSPSVMLMPSEDDFSGSSWLAGSEAEVSLEAFVAPVQTLPFEAIRGTDGGLGTYPRRDPGPGSRWSVTGGGGPLPQVPAVPLPAEGGVRVLEGFEGWRLAREIRLAPLDGGVLAQRAVVRVVLDETGAPASSPVLWESSGAAIADEAALRLARGIQMIREGSESGTEAEEAPRHSWGFLGITWPAPRAEAAPEQGRSP